MGEGVQYIGLKNLNMAFHQYKVLLVYRSIFI
jgi:hypothetical protein